MSAFGCFELAKYPVDIAKIGLKINTHPLSSMGGLFSVYIIQKGISSSKSS